MADSNEAERRSDMREFTAQLVKLTDAVGDFGERMAGLEQWVKTAGVDLGEYDKMLRAHELKIANTDNRVSLVFAAGAGAWSLFVIVFAVVAANIIERLSQLPH